MNFLVAPANVADNNHRVLHTMLDGLKGECYGDRGHVSRLFEHFYLQGLQTITKLKPKMKNQLPPLSQKLRFQKLRLKKRAVIESVSDILTSVLDVEHTRHRNPFNALAHIFSGLIACRFYEGRPSVFAPDNQSLMIAQPHSSR